MPADIWIPPTSHFTLDIAFYVLNPPLSIPPFFAPFIGTFRRCLSILILLGGPFNVYLDTSTASRDIKRLDCVSGVCISYSLPQGTDPSQLGRGVCNDVTLPN